MKKLILFYLPDCNVSKLFEERLHKALALPEFAGRFNLIRHNLYTDTGRQEARSVGISDAPTAYCDGKDRCCQLIINSAERISWKEVESIEELGESERGNKGFGEGTGGAAKA